VGTAVETRRDGSRVCAWSCAVALVLPWLTYAQPGVYSNLVWGGNACPYGSAGSLWFKANTSFEKLVVRLFMVQAFGLLMAYVAKLLTQDHLPLGIAFPIRSSTLRFALPAYFLAFWGLVGRIMQTSFTDVSFVVLVEGVLIMQEVLQVWAYMHHKGPLAYLLALALGRGSAKVAADQATPEYRSLDDIPSKAFTYNFLICAHAVCEAVTVLIAGFLPLAYNMNINDYGLVPRGQMIVNLIISLVGETIVADGLFCVMAAREQRKAHTFLATWQLRPRGSITVFLVVTLAAFLPVWYTLLLSATMKKDDSHFGYHSVPQELYIVDILAYRYNRSTHGVATQNEYVNLRAKCGPPPGEVSNEVWCFADERTDADLRKCCEEMDLCPCAPACTW